LLKWLSMLLLAVIAATAIVAWEARQRWQEPLVIADPGYHLTVSAGQTLRGLAQQLQLDGVYSSPWLLRLYGRWSGLDQQIKRGEYLVPKGMDAKGLLLLLQSGKVISYQLTLPEGITLARAIEILAADSRLKHVLAGPEDPQLAEFSTGRVNGEGLFFPDSYRFERGASDLDILQRAYDAMQQVLHQEWQQRAEQLPYDSSYEALIMASIVERETGVPRERGEIAGVFVRRLQQRMRLQTDPTVIYGLGDSYRGNLTRAHLKDDSNSYNTYRIKGLPPGPIALPGREAIHAALHPVPGKTLYFVARGDGSHQFSETLAEHQQAVRKYQLRRRADYRSTPEKQ
jgi:peptidoglycan lytic transglycosylase G